MLNTMSMEADAVKRRIEASKLWIEKYGKSLKTTNKAEKALAVMVLDGKISSFLAEHDPKALEQAHFALFDIAYTDLALLKELGVVVSDEPISVNVLMMAFGRTDNEVRAVDIPAGEWPEQTHLPTRTESRLEQVFYYGQNDFQPKQHPSVSAGDVIELEGKHHLVMPVGFTEISDEQLAEYKAMPRRDRPLFVGKLHDEQQKKK